MKRRTTIGLLLALLCLVCGVAVYLIVNYQDLRIRWLISRIGKDRHYVSGHLYIDSSHLELERIGPRAVPQLVGAFDGSGPWQRNEIVLTLWGIGDRSCTPTLIKALSDPSEEVRQTAALAIGHLEISEAIPELRKRLNDPDNIVRRCVIYACGALHDKESVPTLLEATQDADPLVRREAATALNSILNVDVNFPYESTPVERKRVVEQWTGMLK